LFTELFTELFTDSSTERLMGSCPQENQKKATSMAQKQRHLKKQICSSRDFLLATVKALRYTNNNSQNCQITNTKKDYPSITPLIGY